MKFNSYLVKHCTFLSIKLAHVVDNSIGSFAGQIIADSYESNVDDIRIQDYQSASNGKCQAFVGCV